VTKKLGNQKISDPRTSLIEKFGHKKKWLMSVLMDEIDVSKWMLM